MCRLVELLGKAAFFAAFASFFLLPSSASGQELKVQAAGWTNRSVKVWDAKSKNAKNSNSTANSTLDSSSSLPWRSTNIQSTSLNESENVASAPSQPIRSRITRPVDEQRRMELARINAQQSLRRSGRRVGQGEQASRVPPNAISAASFDNPFGDAGTDGVVFSSGRSAESKDAFADPFGDRSNRPVIQESETRSSSATPASFDDPFGQSQGTAQLTAGEGDESLPKFELLPYEESVESTDYGIQTPTAMRTNSRRLIRQARTNTELGGLQIGQPQVAYQTPVMLRVAPATRSLVPSLSPQVEPDSKPDDTLGDVPEFPDYKFGSEEPPTPDKVKGNDLPGMPELPDVEEPDTPKGYGEVDNVLPEPRDSESDDDSDESDSDDDSDEDDDEDEDEDDDSDDDDSGCGRVYNERNCCEQDEVCRTAWDRLNAITISDIDLNISPPLAPLAEDDTEIDEQRERLEKMPVRDFRDRTGTIVATGSLENFINGKVIIRTTDGSDQAIRFSELGYDARCFVSAWWGIPNECLIQPDQLAIRDWTMTTFTWKASAVCHKSLFFEDTQLERYGHSAGPVLQPLISGAHFFANVALLPYNAGVYPPTECHYVLGYYRPGECAPWMVPAFPLSRRGAVMETAGLLGFFGLF